MLFVEIRTIFMPKFIFYYSTSQYLLKLFIAFLIIFF